MVLSILDELTVLNGELILQLVDLLLVLEGQDVVGLGQLVDRRLIFYDFCTRREAQGRKCLVVID